ncbi:MAG: aminotransferase class IV, partial [Clostridia bacterium]|nr:aminotransferase class IV [Clostridia bacterium]
MINLGYYNGKYGPIEEMTVPMNDRACFFGDGIYDATVGENHVIYLLEEHLDRFFRNIDRLKLNFTMTRDELRATLNELIGQVDGCVMVYWQATRGTAMRAHAFPDTPANLWIMIKPLTMRDPLKRIALTEMEDKRFLYCDIKTLNLLP